jgi:hypothetical protein
MLPLPALNAMLTITTTRTLATSLHPPPMIFMRLGRLALAVYVMLDLEFPRLGLIQCGAFDYALVEPRQRMQ